MTKSECQCAECKSACEYNPGWFMPSEAEKVAKFLGLSLADFFEKYLGVNWWESDSRSAVDIFVLAPAIISMTAGQEYPSDPRGRCIFFENGLCKIHSIKPFECAEFIHTQDRQIVNERHWQIAKAWEDHQSQIKELLGRDPESSPLNFLDFLFAR